jgi:hypothetical protein
MTIDRERPEDPGFRNATTCDRRPSMKTLPNALLAATVAALFAAAPALQAQEGPPEDSGRPLSATLTGDAETGGGDPDGAGTATFRLNQGQGEICYEISVSGIDAATAAHIHRGEEGMSGPPVVTLDPPSNGSVDGCVTADSELIMEIRQNPGSFYVNVHNAEFGGGAVRGQLTK